MRNLSGYLIADRAGHMAVSRSAFEIRQVMIQTK